MAPHPHSADEDTALQDTFRMVMSTVCTPVSVVTAITDGRPHGTTVSAFTSLSMRPPMALVCLDRDSDLLTIVRTTGHFGLNVLGSDQSALALRFARKGPDKFAGVAWVPIDEVPAIVGVGGFLSCRVAQLVDGGDHVVVLGDVVAATTAHRSPLTYHGRAFGTHTPLEEAIA